MSSRTMRVISPGIRCWFPMFDRNPQTFVDIYKATETDFQKTTHTVYHSREFPSHITALSLK